MDLSSLWLQMTDPSMLQDPETVAAQVASLTEFASETLKRLNDAETCIKWLQRRIRELETVNER